MAALQQAITRKTPLKELQRNFMRIGCPACGESCAVQSSDRIVERGKDAFVACKNIECGYRGTLEVSYGPVIRAANPRIPEPVERIKPGVRNAFLRIVCPHCAGVCRVRTSGQSIKAQKRCYAYCQNIEGCGYEGVVFITHADRLSIATDGDLTEIPLAPEVQQQCQREMDMAFAQHHQNQKKGNY